MLDVTINPYYRSVRIDGIEVRERIIPYPDFLNHIASVRCTYDENMSTITSVKGVYRYTSHMIEKQYYFKWLPAFIEWFKLEKQAQEDVPIVNSVSVNSNAPVFADLTNNVALKGIVEKITINDGIIAYIPDADGLANLKISYEDLMDLPDLSDLEKIEEILNSITYINNEITDIKTEITRIIELIENTTGVTSDDLTNTSYNYYKKVDFFIDTTEASYLDLELDKTKYYQIELNGNVIINPLVHIDLVNSTIPVINTTDKFYEIELNIINNVQGRPIKLILGDVNIDSLNIDTGNTIGIILRKYFTPVVNSNPIEYELGKWELHGYTSNPVVSTRDTENLTIDPYSWLHITDTSNSFSEVIQGYKGYIFTSTSNSPNSGAITLIRGIQPKSCSFKVRLVNKHSNSTQWPIDVGIGNLNDSFIPSVLFSVNVPYNELREYTINCTYNSIGDEVWSWYQNEIDTNTSLADSTSLQAGVVKYDNKYIIKNSSNQLTIDTTELSSELSEKTLPDGITINFNSSDKLKIVPYNTIQEFGAINTITLNIATETSVSVKPATQLTVQIEKLANNIDKLSTLIIIPTAATSINWLFNNVANTGLWTSEETVDTLLVGEVGIVNIWQQAGGCLLSKVYKGVFNV